jgi:Inosine-uridine preferring nucleoside hydrolase
MHLSMLSRLLFALTVMTGLAAATPAQAAYMKPSACTLIDTDYDIDDMMAIPMLLGNRYVAAIITSEGYTLPAAGAGALARLIAEPGQRPIPLIIGQTTNLPRNEILTKWGQFVLDYRAMMNKSFALMSAPLPPSPQDRNKYVRKVVDSLKYCKSVDILIIGTFSSFINYSPAIRSKIKNVVIMGKPLRGDPNQAPGNYSFNCEYDLAACKLAFKKQLPGLKYFYVDPTRSAFDSNPLGKQDFVYGPTRDMVEALGQRGLPYALKQALLGTVRDGSLGAAVDGADYWAIDCCFRAGGKSLLWDQSAALFMLHPEIFRNVGGAGGHYEPTVTPNRLRQLWTDASNKSVNYVDSQSSQ